MKNILFINYSCQLGGAEHSLLDMIIGLSNKNYKITLIVFGNGPLIEKAQKYAKVYSIPFKENLESFRRDSLLFNIIMSPIIILKLFLAIFKIRKIIKSCSFDIIHANNPKSHLFALFALISLKIPLVIHLRDVFKKFSFAYFIYYLIGFKENLKSIAISSFVYNAIPNSLKKNTTLIYNGFKLQPCIRSSEDIRHDFNIAIKDNIAITVGRIVPWKRINNIIDELEKQLKNKNLHLIIVGDSLYWNRDYYYSLKQAVRQRKLDKKIHFTGYREDIASLFYASDFFIINSIDEPFGRVAVEAMLCKLPVIATKSGGLKEIITSGKTGLLVDPNKKGKLEAAVKYLLDDKETRIQMGKHGKESALSKFSIDTTINNIIKLYKQL